VRDEHRVQIVEAAQVIAQLSLTDLDDQRRRVGRVVAIRLEARRARRGLELPRHGLGSIAFDLHVTLPFLLRA
jgi:hypothetical protein